MPTARLAAQVHAGFPGAIPAADFVRRWVAACTSQGFAADNSLLVVGLCRDEVCFPFLEALEHEWGPAFQAGSLGGLLTIGRTGAAAAAGHAPQDAGQPPRYVVLAAAHIGMDADGTFGYLRRPHQDASSRTCGALMTFRDELLTGRLTLGYDPLDPEMSLLRQRIMSALPYGDIPDPVGLTDLVARVIDDDLAALLAWMASTERGPSLAVVTGVLVHTAQGDWFQAHRPRVIHDGAHEAPVDLGLAHARSVARQQSARSYSVGLPAVE